MMNERIRQLAQQAGFQPYITTHEEDLAMFEKFAELIVKECASRVRFTDLLECNDDSDGEILLQASVQLKQYFGVEG
jgi:hypothetical protein